MFPLSGYRLASSGRSLASCRSWSMRVAAMVSLQGMYEGPGARDARHPVPQYSGHRWGQVGRFSAAPDDEGAMALPRETYDDRGNTGEDMIVRTAAIRLCSRVAHFRRAGKMVEKPVSHS